MKTSILAGTRTSFCWLSLIVLVCGFFTAVSHASSLKVIDRIIFHHTKAQSYHDWLESPFHPAQLQIPLQKLAESPSSLCDKLENLAPEHLILFEELLHQQWSALTCSLSLQSRLLEFWQRSKKMVESSYQLHRGTKSAIAVRREPGAPLGPSLVHRVDPPTRTRLVDGGLKEGQFALTFDDGPHPARTDSILDSLKKFDVQATFFVLGKNTDRYPEIVQRIAFNGHSIGNHSYSHPSLPRLSQERAIEEIHSGFDSIFAAIGIDTPFFRYPYGASSTALNNHLRNLRVSRFFWNVDTLDWKIRDASHLYEKTIRDMQRVKKGIILFHDIQKITTIVVPWLLLYMQDNGLEPVVFQSTQL